MVNVPSWPPAMPCGGRQADVQQLAAAAAAGHCLSLVGVSNVGKSYVLRALCRAPTGDAAACAFVYIDCNRMVEFTEQGFYELVLRCIKSALPPAAEAGLASELARCYDDVVAPSSPFLAHLRFSEAIAAASERWGRRLVLVLDEFDQIMRGIDDRVLLNLRALRDTYPDRLSYITASRRRLGTLRHAHGSSELAELFGQGTSFLAPLTGDAAGAFIGECVRKGRLALVPADVPLMLEETGGHPALMVAAAYALSALRQDAQAIGRSLSQERIHEQLDSDAACQAECVKIWQALDQEERLALLRSESQSETARQSARQALQERHVLLPGEGGLTPFCRLFASYVLRQRIVRRPENRGVRVDVESGDVWVDGRLIPALTDLEYRLLLLLYGHLDKIVDKYTLVKAVWGQSYIDEVDDGRIEKLVSRLRRKLQPEPGRPHYLQTIRNRGYKLVSGQ